MKELYRVELAFKKDPGKTVGLDYVLVPLAKAQKRFESRLMLKPQLDLLSYSCSAVIDWIDIDLTLGRTTQFRFLKKELDDHLGASHHTEPATRAAGGTTDRFRVRFQEARLPRISGAMERVRLKFGLAADPEVAGMEVSIDFRPKDFSDDARARMVGLLMWHLFPAWDYMSDREARPRFTWEPGSAGTAHLVRWNARTKNNADYVRFNIDDRPAAVDATLYVGRRTGPLLWSVQNKTRDKQNREAGTWLELADKDRRARVEVTLRGEELEEIGVRTLSDLRSFKFGKLQGRYFRAMLPTFAATKGDPVAEWKENQRRLKFLNTGVLGLTAMDEARNEASDRARSDVAKRARANRGQMISRKRVGRGSSVTLVTFEELARRFRTALDLLTKREQEQTPR